jgi:hypothetical protein
MPTKLDQQDIDAVEKSLGPLPPNASTAEKAERYRLWQAQKLIRLYGHGKLPGGNPVAIAFFVPFLFLCITG